MTQILGFWGLISRVSGLGSKDPNRGALGPRFSLNYSIWAPKPHDLGPEP